MMTSNLNTSFPVWVINILGQMFFGFFLTILNLTRMLEKYVGRAGKGANLNMHGDQGE